MNVTGWNSTGYNFVYVPGDGTARGGDGNVQAIRSKPEQHFEPFPRKPQDGGNYGCGLDSDFEQGPFSTTVTGLTQGQTVTVSSWAGGQQNQSSGSFYR